MPATAGDMGDEGSMPELGRSSGEGNGTPFQYSYLENPMDRVAWQARVHSHKELDMTEHTCNLQSTKKTHLSEMKATLECHFL